MDENIKHIDLDRSSQKKPKKKKGVIFWACLVLMISSLIALGVIGAGYIEGCVMYNDISDEVFDGESLNLADMKVDWEKLLSINSETVGWIYIPGTRINYPVVHTSDNEKYLKTTFRGYKSNVSFGAIFMDFNNKHDLSDENIVLYGHNMNDSSMFSTFAKFKEQSFFDANRNVYFLTPQGNYRLKTFAFDHVASTDKIIQVSFGSKANKVKYIMDKIDRSVVSVSDIPDPSAMTKIFTFSTCDNSADNGRYVTFAYVAESTVDGVPGLE